MLIKQPWIIIILPHFGGFEAGAKYWMTGLAWQTHYKFLGFYFRVGRGRTIA